MSSPAARQEYRLAITTPSCLGQGQTPPWAPGLQDGGRPHLQQLAEARNESFSPSRAQTKKCENAAFGTELGAESVGSGLGHTLGIGSPHSALEGQFPSSQG